MTIKHSPVQPESFAWQIDPLNLFKRLPKDKLIAACQPICDMLAPMPGIRIRAQLDLAGSFTELNFDVDAFGQLHRGAFRFAPIMSLLWQDEVVYLYVKGQVAIRSGGRTVVLQYHKE